MSACLSSNRFDDVVCAIADSDNETEMEIGSTSRTRLGCRFDSKLGMVEVAHCHRFQVMRKAPADWKPAGDPKTISSIECPKCTLLVRMMSIFIPSIRRTRPRNGNNCAKLDSG